MPLYTVHKTRRGNRRGKPWLLCWRDPPESGERRQKTIGPMPIRLADQHRIAWQCELNGFSADVAAGGATWGRFEADYLASAAADLAPASAAIARQTLKRFREAIRPRLLAEVDVAAVERYRVGRLGQAGPETVRKDVRTLRAALSWARDMGLVTVNPFDGARVGRRQRRDVDALSVGQTAAFLEELTRWPTWVQASLRLTCLWGPRAGELAGIVREDVDAAAGTVRIPVTGRRTTKGGRGRTIPLDSETAGLLQELSHRDIPILWGPLDKPFTTGRGKGGFVRTLGGIAREVLAKVAAEVLAGQKFLSFAEVDLKAPALAPLGEKVQPLQFLRRTAETNMRRRGVPAMMISRIIGHGTRVGDEWYDGQGPDEAARQVEQLMRDFTARERPRPEGPESLSGNGGA
jgi:integrase